MGADASAQEDLWDIRVGATVRVEAELDRQRSRNPGQSDQENSRNHFDEQLGLLVRGHFFRPDLFRYTLNGDLGLRQTRLGSSGESATSQHGQIRNYDAALDLLSELPISLNLFGSRADDQLARNLLADTETSAESRGATLRFRNSIFPMALTHRTSRSISRSSGVDTARRQDVETRILEFNGTRSSLASNLRLRARDEERIERGLPSAPRSRLQEIEGSAGQRWGEYFEHWLTTSGRYSVQSGVSQREASSAESSYVWEMTDDLTTRLRYRLDRLVSQDQATTNQSGSASLEHRFYDSIASSVAASADRTSQDQGSQTTTGWALGLNYRKRLPWATRLNADFRIDRQIQDSDLDSPRVAVIQQALSLDGAGEGFLEHSWVDESTIIVRDEAGLPLDEGRIAVHQIGERTSIQVLSGDVGGMPSKLLVDYTYETAPLARIQRTRSRWGVGWDSSWFAFRYTHQTGHEDLLGGRVRGPLDRSHGDSYSVDLRRQLGSLRSSARVMYVRRISHVLAEERWTFRQSMVWSPLAGLFLQLTAQKTLGDFETVDPRTDDLSRRSTDLLSVTSTISWRSRRGAILRVFSNYRASRDSTAGTQRNLKLGLRSEIPFGRLRLYPTLEWTTRARGSAGTEQLHAGIGLLWRL